MTPSTWADFDLESALERDMLTRALPLLPIDSRTRPLITIDLASRATAIHLSSHSTIGPTPQACVELLQVRPLLVGTAWKVMDLAIETALNAAGLAPRDGRSSWEIKDKCQRARRHSRKIRPSALPLSSWKALIETYVGTVDLRHSLVHRRAWTDAANALVGVKKNGHSTRPLTVDEQEAFGRSAIRAAEALLATPPDSRVIADLVGQQAVLASIHKVSLPVDSLPARPPAVAVVLDPIKDDPNHYRLPIPTVKIRARRNIPSFRYADLIVRFRDRPGLELRGRVEDAPHRVLILDPLNPPAWLT